MNARKITNETKILLFETIAIFVSCNIGDTLERALELGAVLGNRLTSKSRGQNETAPKNMVGRREQ